MVNLLRNFTLPAFFQVLINLKTKKNKEKQSKPAKNLIFSSTGQLKTHGTHSNRIKI
jgi:hypothetical protein